MYLQFLLFFGGTFLIRNIKFKDKQINIWKVVISAIISVIIYQIFDFFVIGINSNLFDPTILATKLSFSASSIVGHIMCVIIAFIQVLVWIFIFGISNKIVFGLKSCIIDKKHIAIICVLILIFLIIDAGNSIIYTSGVLIDINGLFGLVGLNISQWWYSSSIFLLQSAIMGVMAIGISKKGELE